jgi:hypothetical protein
VSVYMSGGHLSEYVHEWGHLSEYVHEWRPPPTYVYTYYVRT